MSLDMLKAGWCTIQFNAFLQEKMATQTLIGGNTTEIYQDGTFEKSKMLANEHPDVSKVVWKFGRVHHHVNYNSFKRMKLLKRDGLGRIKKKDAYGMKLRGVQHVSIKA